MTNKRTDGWTDRREGGNSGLDGKHRYQKTLQLKTYFSGGVTSRPTLNESSVAQEHIKERERELERIHRRSRELMLSPRLMDCSGGISSRDSSVDRSQRSG